MKSPFLIRLEYYFFMTLVGILYWLPFAVLEWMARRVGDCGYALMAKRRRIGMENITRAFGNSISEKRKKNILLKSLRNQIISVMELITVKRFIARFEERVTIHGLEHIDYALKEGKGLFLVLGHLGQWEYMSFITRLIKTPSAVIVKNLRNPLISKKLHTLRTSMGVEVLPKDSAPTRRVLQTLRQNGIVGVLIDQWAGGEGIWIDLFGEATSTTSMPARIAEKTGAKLLFAHCIRTDGGRFRMDIEPPLSPDFSDPHWEKNITLELNQILEGEIKRYPEHWNWMHRRWKNKPGNLRKPA